jgi:MoxR-like ATPase
MNDMRAEPAPPPAPAAVQALRESVLAGVQALCRVVVGKDSAVRRSVAVMLAAGHLLIEDLPGVGKTTLAKGLSRIMGGTYQRIQGTNDLLPSDLVGVHLWDAHQQAFRFQQGPVFANVLLLDELNRIGPKTQSALMEVLVEGQVSLDRASYPLPDPFFAIATQNPMDHAGTFPLPESQIDRFACVLHLGYPDPSAERLVLRGEAGTERLESLEPAMDLAGWRLARSLVHDVRLADASMAYLERVVERIRSDKGFCSTRAAGHWLALAKAEAWLDSRDFVTPDDLQATLEDVMAHRGTLDGRRLNRDDRREQLGRLLSEVPVGWKP